jgi:hypothetical protein
VRSILANLDNQALVIQFLKRHGLAIPRVNIQNDKGKAKAYQVRQVLLAIDKLKGSKNEH